ncbi:MAG: helix-turn-helix transcriptional regulator [Clostridia bacterium]|nr:helix-turn-helix transcriptional regulator [Clostridia bacterium]
MGKWKLSILWMLHKKTRRFNEIQRLMPSISRGVLTNQLRELENDKLILRKVYNQVPPKVEYSLTQTGESFIPIMMHIIEWGIGYVKEIANCDFEVCKANKFPCNKCHEMYKPEEPQLNT